MQKELFGFKFLGLSPRLKTRVNNNIKKTIKRLKPKRETSEEKRACEAGGTIYRHTAFR